MIYWQLKIHSILFCVQDFRLLVNLQYLLLSFFCIDEIVTGKFFDYRGQFSWLFSFFTEFIQVFIMSYIELSFCMQLELYLEICLS